MQLKQEYKIIHLIKDIENKKFSLDDFQIIIFDEEIKVIARYDSIYDIQYKYINDYIISFSVNMKKGFIHIHKF